ncbi:hypothetical protein PC116_g25069 [Phytophthora cactorum]|nr:hypothetical protein PC116_g25069 [Phytophthora cactorum]
MCGVIAPEGAMANASIAAGYAAIMTEKVIGASLEV